jgi:hypothetical protein
MYLSVADVLRSFIDVVSATIKLCLMTLSLLALFL